MTRRRRARPAPPPAALEDDDLLRKIFLLLPPQPSTLPCVSVVCKQWRDVVTDPQFLRGFRDQHRRPPLLGLVMGHTASPYFRSDLNPPDHIPHERFFPRDIRSMNMDIFDCRHGRVVFFAQRLGEVVLFDPATGGRRCVVVPPVFHGKEIGVFNAAVICVSGDEGHVHGDCHASPFQVVLMGISDDYKQAFASVYSSESGIWGDIISIENREMYDLKQPSTLIGNALYWLFPGDDGEGILEFDLGRQSLANIEMPQGLVYYSPRSLQVMVADGGCVGLAILSCYRFEMWERKVSCDDGVAGWVLQKTVQLNTILGLGPMGGLDNLLMGYDEVDHVIYIRTDIGFYMVRLESMQFRNLGKDNFSNTSYLPYRSFYTAVSDLAVCERTGELFAPLANDYLLASWGVEAVGGNEAATLSETSPEGGTVGMSKHIDQGKDADPAPSRALKQTRIDVIFKKETETRSKLSKAWAKWFRSNGVPANKADCPHFCSALKLTQQLGTRLVAPTGNEIDSANLDASDEELP
ncbi:uncharacterized protein LOC119353914 [Triticum dicoccoides]|uniref:F-box domain-containing protein n=1 Tax=Triticum turgidum subsp. durum TaxID=4567 RepID=A0A9R1R4S3_TRITD|nr:uncharacterized protein LOC119353914 [Triticum dicoccoides]VAH28285.1 unnamed protein product [Triticum turgidum subsp. durum]